MTDVRVQACRWQIFFASGGLSQFVVIEDLDRSVLAGLESGDARVFEQIPVQLMRSGTSDR